MPRLIHDLAQRSLDIRLDLHGRSPGTGVDIDSLHRGTLDCLLYPHPANTTGLALAHLYDDDFSCLVLEPGQARHYQGFARASVEIYARVPPPSDLPYSPTCNAVPRLSACT